VQGDQVTIRTELNGRATYTGSISPDGDSGPGGWRPDEGAGPGNITYNIAVTRGQLAPSGRSDMGERTRYEPGSFCWAGLATSDPAAAEAFYTRLFGWEAQALSAGEAGAYTIVRRADQDVAILYRQTAQARAAGAPPHWTSYISVEDANATAARAEQLGGAAVFREPFDVPGGRVAAIEDPAGAVVSLWQPRPRIGATLVNDVGALCWNELATTDVWRAKSFYGALLGWQYQASDRGSATITNAGRRNGSIRPQAGQERDTPPAWLPYFAVGDADHATRHAGQEGGRTLLPATEIRRGRFAVIADPQGATFAVFQGQTDP
jgi:predicted enzyme related to lactoylglutathione lyase